MRHLLFPLFVSSALALAAAPSTASAEAPSAQVAPEQLVLDHLESLRVETAGSPSEAVAWSPRLTLPWAGGTRVRVEQQILGLPVDAGDLVVSLSPAGTVLEVIGNPVDGVLMELSPLLEASEAEERAVDMVVAMFGGEGSLWPPRSEPVVRIDRLGQPQLAWRVDLSIAEPLGIWQVILDADDGRITALRSGLHNSRGNVYPTNPSTSEVTEVDLLRLDSNEATQGLQGEFAYVNSCDEVSTQGGGTNCIEKSRHASEDADGNFLFEADPTSLDDPFAEVQMYYHLDLISDWFASEHSFQLGMPIEGLVNFEYNNAVYGDLDGDGYGEVAFGQNSTSDFAYDADVIYHEFGHAVFGRVAGQTGFLGADEYGVEWATGGINEGTADLFSLILTEDPDLGEYAGSGFGLLGPIRDLEPDRHCPTDLYGESHEDGMVFGSLGWNLIEDPLLGAELVGDLIYGTVISLPVNANWQNVSEGLVTTAQDLLDAEEIDETQHQAISEHLQASGLDDCGRVIRLDEDQEPTLQMVAVSFFEDATIPLGHQFSLDLTPETYRVRLRVKELSSRGGGPVDSNLGWIAFGRQGEHIIHDIVPVDTAFGSIETPVPDVFEHSFDGEGDDVEINAYAVIPCVDAEHCPDGSACGADGTCELGDEDSFYFERPETIACSSDADCPDEVACGEGGSCALVDTYYFSMASRQLGSLNSPFTTAEVTVDGRVWTESLAPIVEVPEEGDGCEGCASAGVTPRSGGLALLLWACVAAGLRRRPRRAQD